jgi:hypothetical protein
MRSRSWLSSAAAVAGTILLTAAIGAAASLTVTVVDRESGAPLEKATVAVIAGDALVATGRTNKQGVWRGTVTQQPVAAVASKRLYNSAGAAAISFDEKGNRQIRLELAKHQSSDFKRMGRIVGFVRNAEGQPLGNATLVLMKKKGPVGAAHTENATGVYELEWYPPGTYRVLATAPGHKSSKYAGQSIQAGESLWLDVTLQPK